MRNAGILTCLILLTSMASCHCEPRRTPSRSTRQAPEPPPKTVAAPTRGTALDLSSESKRDSTEACGECCSVREISTTHVSVAMLEDLTSQGMDTGTVTHVETTSGVQMITSRTWSFHWTGSWYEDQGRRMMTLKSLTSSCTETFSVREPARNVSTDEDRDCPVAPSVLELLCVSGPDPDGSGTIWMCGESRPTQYPGTPLPWKLHVQED